MITALITLLIAGQMLLIGYMVKKKALIPHEKAMEDKELAEKALLVRGVSVKLMRTGYAGLIFGGLQLINTNFALPLFFLYLLVIVPAVFIRLFFDIKKATTANR